VSGVRLYASPEIYVLRTALLAVDATSRATTDDSDDEEFIYPVDEQEQHTSPDISTMSVSSSHAQHSAPALPEVEDDTHEAEAPPQPQPSPAQLEALFASSSSGDLRQLQSIFRNARETAAVEPFALANDASSRTGLTALHAAASRGYLDIVSWCERKSQRAPLNALNY
jgi:hypothetical protein